MNLPDEVSKLKADATRVFDVAMGDTHAALACFNAHRKLAIASLTIAFVIGVSFGLAW